MRPAAVTGLPAHGVDMLTVGEAMAVLCPDPPGPLRHASSLSMSVAGAEANVAVHLARLGLRATFVSRIGADPLGEMIRDRLTSTGVEAILTVDPARPTGVYFKDPAPKGTRVHYYRAGSAASAMDATIWPACPRTRLVHLCGVTPALSASCAEMVAEGIVAARRQGALVSFDVNHRPGLWTPERAAGPLRELANRADLVFVGLDEAGRLWGTQTPEEVRQVLHGCQELVIKDGDVGATVFGTDGVTFEPAVPVEVVEPVGAGDAFAAGYLFGLLSACPPGERLRYGHHLAGLALRTSADVSDTQPDPFMIQSFDGGHSHHQMTGS